MNKYYKEIIIKTLVFTLIFSFIYAVAVIKPEKERREKRAEISYVLSLHTTNLIQNRLAYIELTKLDPGSANFQYQTANIIDTLQKTQKEGLDLVKEKNNIPDLKNFDINFPKLLTETESVYRQQEEIINEVIKTEKYDEGVEILKSDKAIELLTNQTNLILEYEYWLGKIN